MKAIDATNDIENTQPAQSQVDPNNLQSLRIGAGNRAMKADESGLWLGADKFEDAPFSVDMDGKLTSSNITIKNDQGTTVIDSNGIISSNVFPYDQVVKSVDQTISGTSFVDVTSLSVTKTFNATRTVNVLFFCTITGSHVDYDGVLVFRFVDGSTPFGIEFMIPNVSQDGLTNLSVSASTTFIAPMTAGSHTIKIQARSNNASPSNGYIETIYTNSVMGYVILGS